MQDRGSRGPGLATPGLVDVACLSAKVPLHGFGRIVFFVVKSVANGS